MRLVTHGLQLRDAHREFNAPFVDFPRLRLHYAKALQLAG